MIVIFVMSNVITLYDLVGLFELLFILFIYSLIWRTQVSAMEHMGTQEAIYNSNKGFECRRWSNAISIFALCNCKRYLCNLFSL